MKETKNHLGFHTDNLEEIEVEEKKYETDKRQKKKTERCIGTKRQKSWGCIGDNLAEIEVEEKNWKRQKAKEKTRTLYRDKSSIFFQTLL